MWTFFAAIVGSISALLVAFVAYPTQRRLDRHYALQQERRLMYVAFARESQDFMHRLSSDVGWTLEELDRDFPVFLVIEELLVSAPDQVAEPVMKFRDGLDRLYGAYHEHDSADDLRLLNGAVREMREAAIWSMRQDTMDGTKLSRQLFAESARERGASK